MKNLIHLTLNITNDAITKYWHDKSKYSGNSARFLLASARGLKHKLSLCEPDIQKDPELLKTYIDTVRALDRMIIELESK